MPGYQAFSREVSTKTNSGDRMKHTILLAVAFAVVASVQSIPRDIRPVVYDRGTQPGLVIIDTYANDPVDLHTEQDKTQESEKKTEIDEALLDDGLLVEVTRVRRSAETDGQSRPNVNRADIHGAPVPPEEIPVERARRSPKKGRGRIFIRGEAGRGTGRKSDVGVHLGAEYRFRRSVDEEHDASEDVSRSDVSGASTESEETRVRRSPKEPVRGKIVVQGGARKGSSTRGRTQGEIYVGGQIRFRRSIDGGLVDNEIVSRTQEESEEMHAQRSVEVLVDEAVERDVVSEEKDNLDLLGPPVISRYPAGNVAVVRNTIEGSER